MRARLAEYAKTRPRIWLYAGVVLLALLAGLACETPAPAPATATPNGAVTTATATPHRDATASTATPAATATPDSATAPATPASTPGPVSFADPPGDCWGGALSADPVHCHALEEIQRDDLIEVEGMYEGGGVLYVYIRLAGSIATPVQAWTTFRELSESMAEIATDFAIKNPDKVADEHAEPPLCDPGGSAEDIERCKAFIFWTFLEPGAILPWDSDYTIIYLRPGGAEARKNEGGWASWRQLWPEPPQPMDGTQTGPGSTPGAAYDVSGVDTTNIPEIVCWDTSAELSCDVRNKYPGFDIVGSYWAGEPSYYYVKAAPGKEEEVTAALAAEFTRLGYDMDTLVIIPSKYSFDEYWKWAVILDRFALSSGNTIGLKGAEVGTNIGAFHEVIFPLPNLGPSRAWDKSDMRTTIKVWGYDVQVMADALPTLLPLLGIPVDAVGVVGRIYDGISIVVPAN